MTRADLDAALGSVGAIGARICPDPPDPWRQGFEAVLEAIRNADGLELEPFDGLERVAAQLRGNYNQSAEDYRAGARRAVHELRVLFMAAIAAPPSSRTA